LDWYYLI